MLSSNKKSIEGRAEFHRRCRPELSHPFLLYRREINATRNLC